MLDLELITPPTADLVSLEALKEQVAATEFTDDDDLITAARDAVVGHLDGYSGVLGRALAEQTWRLHLDRFPRRREIRLPLPPLLGVESITYLDLAGVQQTLGADQYRVLTGERAALVLASGAAWPATLCEPRAVSVTFRCGWAAPTGDEAWPVKLRPVIAAIKLMVGDLYANRETGVVGTVAAEIKMSTTVDRLLAPLRVPRI